MKTRSAVLGAAGLFIAALSMSACAPTAQTQPEPSVVVVPSPEATPPCAEEGSPGPCFWDAATRDNKAGRSFYVDAAQVVHYKD